jgi:hypothetical protein
MVVNLASEARDVTLRIDNASFVQPAETWRLDAAHGSAEPAAPTHVGAETTLTLPPESVELLVLPQTQAGRR